MNCDEQKRFRNSLGRSRHLFFCRGKFVYVIVRLFRCRKLWVAAYVKNLSIKAYGFSITQQPVFAQFLPFKIIAFKGGRVTG